MRTFLGGARAQEKRRGSKGPALKRHEDCLRQVRRKGGEEKEGFALLPRHSTIEKKATRRSKDQRRGSVLPTNSEVGATLRKDLKQRGRVKGDEIPSQNVKEETLFEGTGHYKKPSRVQGNVGGRTKSSIFEPLSYIETRRGVRQGGA